MSTLNKIANEWNSLNSDQERWEYLLKHPGEFTVKIDNDYTYVDFSNQIDTMDYDDEPELNAFDLPIGNSEGIFELLKSIGIHCDFI